IFKEEEIAKSVLENWKCDNALELKWETANFNTQIVDIKTKTCYRNAKPQTIL
ncbi:4829_t:CDS:2, partial [Diversispora eburnea]